MLRLLVQSYDAAERDLKAGLSRGVEACILFSSSTALIYIHWRPVPFVSLVPTQFTSPVKRLHLITCLILSPIRPIPSDRSRKLRFPKKLETKCTVCELSCFLVSG